MTAWVFRSSEFSAQIDCTRVSRFVVLMSLLIFCVVMSCEHYKYLTAKCSENKTKTDEVSGLLMMFGEQITDLFTIWRILLPHTQFWWGRRQIYIREHLVKRSLVRPGNRWDKDHVNLNIRAVVCDVGRIRILFRGELWSWLCWNMR